MKLYIPTYRRTHRQLTWSFIPPDWRKHAALVCVAEEADTLRRATGANVIVQPKHIKTISAKRQWIVEQCDDEKLVMLDDDLRFCVRDPKHGQGKHPGGGVALNTAAPKDVSRMFGELSEQLDGYAHAGISMRMGNQSRLPGWHENKRICYVLGYKTEVLNRYARFDSIEHREDMWVTLQLLTSGFPNSVSYEFAADQRYGSKGGESAAGRTMEKSNADAVRLAEAFPGVVRIQSKVYKHSTPRTEVIVQWTKAIATWLS